MMKHNQNPLQQKEGYFEFVISDEQGCNIDKCEQALLKANYFGLVPSKKEM